MQQLTTSATLVDYESLASESVITAAFSRRELEEALRADMQAGVWFELEGGTDESRLLTVELSAADIEALLGSATEDSVIFAFDGEDVASLFGESDVEAHGLRGALAIAVAAGAIAAPASLAASPQTVESAATSQQARASVTAQQASAAATSQVSSAGVRSQEARAQIANAAARAQVARSATKAQASTRLVVKASGVSQLRKKFK
jgi:hypothetical protein